MIEFLRFLLLIVLAFCIARTVRTLWFLVTRGPEMVRRAREDNDFTY